MDTPKLLYRRLDALFSRLRPRRSQPKLVESFLDECVASLRDDLRLRAGLLYVERGEVFALARTAGDPGGPVSPTLAPDRVPAATVARHGVYIFGDPLAEDAPARHGLMPVAASAGIAVGERPQRFLLLFVLNEGWQRDELDFALNTVRAALEARLVDARMRGSMREAAEIQKSLLVDEPPVFPGFDIACRSDPAEEVGGDFYDFHDHGGDVLGLAIGDASGHGLPAALLVRDVVTGLRMGIEKELKITRVFEKLNRVIYRSRLSSRFVSVFYGELDANGTLVYVNAGHQPPVLIKRTQPTGELVELELSEGGTVIGPLAEGRFQRGFARLDVGDVLVLFTDGILERRNGAGDYFGPEHAMAVLRAHRDASARAILDALFHAAFTFGDGRRWEDDATIVVVRRAGDGAAGPPSGSAGL